MRGNGEQLVKDLFERLLAWTESGDPAGVLDVAVPRLARDLAETLTHDAQGAAAPNPDDSG